MQRSLKGSLFGYVYNACNGNFSCVFSFLMYIHIFLGDSDSYSNANLDADQNFSIKKEKENSEDGIKSFELCANAHHFPGNYLIPC